MPRITNLGSIFDRLSAVAASEIVEIKCRGGRDRSAVMADLEILGRTIGLVIADRAARGTAYLNQFESAAGSHATKRIRHLMPHS